MNYAPDTIARPADWRANAACRRYPDVFLPPRSEGEGRPGQARQICATCPVRPECLTSAMTEEGNADHHRRAGVRGGLTPAERASLARRIRDVPPEDVTPVIAAVQAQQERTPASVWADHTTPLTEGHTAWTGSGSVAIRGTSYTPMRLAWWLTYGELPEGHLTADCGHRGCVTPGHLVDRGGTYKTALARATASQNGQH
ncbi:WhiB family transcriptional regulator [Streptomyces sp. NPDC058409]|uniref:WhiB family transcriptional regulator n=1 Tax=Streptomyces sp. NPDC058409 TaxID=3346484 RepID=UPI003666BCDC